MQNAKVFDLKQRTAIFSLETIRFLETLSKDYISQVIGRQLLRSATSIGANVIEAQAAPSKRDFANFYNIALKSANESKYWLMLLKNSNRGKLNELESIEREAVELSNILAKCLLTLRNR